MQIQVQKGVETGSEPLSSDLVKNYIKVDFTTDDTLINQQITAARKLCEKYIDGTVVDCGYTVLFYDFQDWDLENDHLKLDLPKPPHINISSVIQIDNEGTETTLTASDYTVFGLNKKFIQIPRQINLSSSTAYQYKVTYTAGMGSEVDEDLKDGILQTIGEIYENRQNEVMGSTVRLTYDAKLKWNPFKNTLIF